MEDFIDYFLLTMMAVMIALLLFLGYLMFKVVTDDKVCVVGHYEKKNGLIYVGNTTIPTQYNSYVCDVWEQ